MLQKEHGMPPPFKRGAGKDSTESVSQTRPSRNNFSNSETSLVEIRGIIEKVGTNNTTKSHTPECSSKDLQKDQHRAKREEEKIKRLAAQELAKGQKAKLFTANPHEMKIFETMLVDFLSNPSQSVNGLIKAVDERLSDEDWDSLVPSIKLGKVIVCCNLSATPEEIGNSIERLKPLVLEMRKRCDNIENFDMLFLYNIQRVIDALGYPRISEDWALIEAVFDALYMKEVFIESVFLNWFDDHIYDDIPGKEKSLFQLLHWFEWLQPQNYIEAQQDSTEEEEDDADYEALIPKRSTVRFVK